MILFSAITAPGQFRTRSLCLVMSMKALPILGLLVGKRLWKNFKTMRSQSVTAMQFKSSNRKDDNRASILLLSTIRFLGRQGLPLRGNYVSGSVEGPSEVNSNFMRLLLLRSNDVPKFKNWLKRAQDKFTSPSIQNEMLQIVALTILCKLASNIRSNYFSILVDETTDASNTDVFIILMISLKPMRNLWACTTTSESNTQTIDDMLRFSLPLSDCHGQR